MEVYAAPSDNKPVADQKVLFQVGGMHSAHCAGVVQQTLKKLSGIAETRLDPHSGLAEIHYQASAIHPKQMADAIRNAGYNPELLESIQSARDLVLEEFAYWKGRTLVAWIFSLPLLLLGMGQNFKLPLPFWVERYDLLIQLVLLIPVLWMAQRFYIHGLKALFINRIPNMDSLVAVGTGAAVLYSLISTGLELLGLTRTGF